MKSNSLDPTLVVDPCVGSKGKESSGVDTTLIDEFLKMTPEERLEYHQKAISAILELRKAFSESSDEEKS